jgi:hypothetical protein
MLNHEMPCNKPGMNKIISLGAAGLLLVGALLYLRQCLVHNAAPALGCAAS